jgi:hypothetical protein
VNPNEKQAPARSCDDTRQMRELGVQRLIASCLSDACRHTALIDVSAAAAEPCLFVGLETRPGNRNRPLNPQQSQVRSFSALDLFHRIPR